MSLNALGWQQHDDQTWLDCVKDLEVVLEERRQGSVQSFQLRGGIPERFSGGPVALSRGGFSYIVGMLSLGGERAGVSRVIAAAPIAAFLASQKTSDVSVLDLPDSGSFRIPSARWNAEKGPAAILKADFEIVPFAGRESELGDLEAWAVSVNRVGVRVYHERGGAGKTRLFIEGCKRLAAKGIRSGFVKPHIPAVELRRLFISTEDRTMPRLVVVIDYAEAELETLANVLRISEDFPQVRLRVILLARGLGDWWEEARRIGDEIGDLLCEPTAAQSIHLGPLGISAQFRAIEFERAVAEFARVLERPLPQTGNVDLSGNIFDRPLLIHMFALFTVLGLPLKVKSDDSDPFLASLWSREKRFLDRAVKSRGIEHLLFRLTIQALAAITAIGGVADSNDALKIVKLLPGASKTDELALREVVRLLHDVYGGETFIDPLQPDILGEYALDKILGDEPEILNDILNR